MRDFGLPISTVLDEVPTALGWALVCWSLWRSPYATMELASDGYVRQEMYRILDAATLSRNQSSKT